MTRFILVLVICCTGVSAVSAQWVKQTVNTTASLRGLSVVNQKVIWASGTGGTVMGAGRGLKARNPRIQSIAVEPAEAMHGLEGLKHMPSSIVPRIYKEAELDRKLSIATDEGWDMAERLTRDEAMLAGHSAGAAAAGALHIARELSERGEEGVIVTLFPDRADRYLPPPP